MDTAQTAGLALVFLIIIKVMVYLVRIYNRQKSRVPSPVVVLVIGSHLSRKSSIARTLQTKLCNASRIYAFATSQEFVERVSPRLIPHLDDSKSVEGGDEMFDAWTISENPDRSVGIRLTEKGTRLMIGIHRGWIEIIRSGNNLVIDYTVHDHLLLKHLLSQLKAVLGRRLDRLIVVEYEESFSLLQQAERDCTNNQYPRGFVLSTFKNLKDLKHISMGSAHRIRPPKTDPTDLSLTTDTVYRLMCQTGLL